MTAPRSGGSGRSAHRGRGRLGAAARGYQALQVTPLRVVVAGAASPARPMAM